MGWKPSARRWRVVFWAIARLVPLFLELHSLTAVVIPVVWSAAVARGWGAAASGCAGQSGFDFNPLFAAFAHPAFRQSANAHINGVRSQPFIPEAAQPADADALCGCE